MDIQQGSGGVRARFSDNAAAGKLVLFYPDQIDRRARAGSKLLQLLVVVLQSAHPSV